RCPCRTAVDSSLTGHAPFAAGDEPCASVYSSRGRWCEKKSAGATPRGGCRRGKEWEATWGHDTCKPSAAVKPAHPQRRAGTRGFLLGHGQPGVEWSLYVIRGRAGAAPDRPMAAAM